MKLAMVLYHYFPYGGLQRDFARIAREAVRRGHQVVALVADWQGDWLEGVTVEQLDVQGSSNHGRMASFARAVRGQLATESFDRVLGFNRLPGLDLYFAADSCFAEHLRSKPGLAKRLPRYRTYLKLEQAVMAEGGPLLLFLNDHQRRQYQAHYPLTESRYRLLPPGIERDRRRTDNYQQLRAGLRAELGLADDEPVLLFLGSGFKVKGLDRALAAFASQPAPLRLLIVGNDDATPYLKVLSHEQRARVSVLGPRDDVPALLQAADLLLHPAYRESAGMVLLEATVAGLPVLTTDTCGYARYVQEAGAGEVIASPFDQQALNRTLANMLAQRPGPWSAAGIEYGQQESLYRLPETVVDWLEGSARD
ncbi:UDP-glucose:(heptosyl) LPS alpha 1,3-glucosyltransferase WaaG [Alcanivorax hongdengensis A-11-3]|uniref:UDP-glucose:(Heptosyl) LPS alpha 1,3-glucosyltransferase WaaG n=1 Tax=Alcanivorax hongdengensis A-11-3 TaxID=1177179 RepID=L0WH46_9GAMM|nr:glycosyltransferase family 4 protein [Alcanivorax hongdengensis]EKF75437.1 UDP-glucose:(heptosyl) LPS alpha 1,3-glucosyltransferase WaaG [Alcanivorax hongdengensis A-11-3]